MFFKKTNRNGRATLALYLQMIYEKPVAFGYVARIPTSVREDERTIKQLVRDNDYRTLFCGYRFKYLATHAEDQIAKGDPSLGLVYQDSKVAIYDLEAASLCANGI